MGRNSSTPLLAVERRRSVSRHPPQPCPICGKLFPFDQIQQHAEICLMRLERQSSSTTAPPVTSSSRPTSALKQVRSRSDLRDLTIRQPGHGRSPTCAPSDFRSRIELQAAQVTPRARTQVLRQSCSSSGPSRASFAKTTQRRNAGITSRADRSRRRDKLYARDSDEIEGFTFVSQRSTVALGRPGIRLLTVVKAELAGMNTAFDHSIINASSSGVERSSRSKTQAIEQSLARDVVASEGCAVTRRNLFEPLQPRHAVRSSPSLSRCGGAAAPDLCRCVICAPLSALAAACADLYLRSPRRTQMSSELMCHLMCRRPKGAVKTQTAGTSQMTAICL